MNPYDIHAQSCEAVQAEQGDDCPTFRWSKQDWRGQISGGRGSKSNSPGGFSFDSDLSIVCGVGQFGMTADALRGKMLETNLVCLGKGYTVKSVTIFPGGKQVRIDCVDRVQGV